MRTRRGIGTRLAGAAGAALVEVAVAAAIGIVVIAASALLFTTGSDSSLASQRQAELVAVADQQIEMIHERLKTNPAGFSALAMNAVPAAGTGARLAASPATSTDPNDFVSPAGGCGASNAGYLIENNYDNTAEGLAAAVAPWSGCAPGAEPLVVDAAGIVTPKQTGVAVGSDTATVYTFVTDTYVGCSSSIGSCGSTAGDARRVVVAVLLDDHGRGDIGQNSPVYISTIFTNPVPSNQPNSSIGVTLGANVG